MPTLLEAWEAVLANDTPHYRESLRKAVQARGRLTDEHSPLRPTSTDARSKHRRRPMGCTSGFRTWLPWHRWGPRACCHRHLTCRPESGPVGISALRSLPQHIWQAFLKAADAMAEARRELVHGLVTAASDAFR